MYHFLKIVKKISRGIQSLFNKRKTNHDVVRNMLKQLSDDFYSAYDKRLKMGDITLDKYCLTYGVTKEQVKVYCDTLPLLEPIYPVCVLCNKPWEHLEKEKFPQGNGQYIDWVDSLSMSCCGGENNENHYGINYYQSDANICSFDMEVGTMFSADWIINWNCNCGVPECLGKNVITSNSEAYNYSILCYFTDEITFKSTKQEIDDFIGKMLLLK